MPNNQLKKDPTRTTTIQRRFMADMQRRFKRLSQNIQELVVEDDAFGLDNDGIQILNQQVSNQAWRFQTDSQKVKSYRKWLKQQIDALVLTVEPGFSGKPWLAPYIESAYKKGAIRAYTDLRSEDLANAPTIFQGGREEFIRTAFSQPVLASKIELLYTRAFTELEGITAAMDQQMSRILAEGLSQGHGPRTIARELRNNVTKINNTRALVLARTEIVRAHAEGQLDAFEILGVEEVGILAEWSTAGDERVCPECSPLEGVVMTVAEARGLIPRHPNCRCAWIPADKNRREKGQKRGSRKDKAIEKSIQAEGGKNTKKRSKRAIKRRSTWTGKEII
jgi:SPP1 gp7 family putative phage head morphogenesis protein